MTTTRSQKPKEKNECHGWTRELSNQRKCVSVRREVNLCEQDGGADLVKSRLHPKAWLCVLGFQDPPWTTLPTSSPTSTSDEEALTLQWRVNERDLMESDGLKTEFLEIPIRLTDAEIRCIWILLLHLDSNDIFAAPTSGVWFDKRPFAMALTSQQGFARR